MIEEGTLLYLGEKVKSKQKSNKQNMEAQISEKELSKTPKEFESLGHLAEAVLKTSGSERASGFLSQLISKLRDSGLNVSDTIATPYTNTIPVEEEVPYPGEREI